MPARLLTTSGPSNDFTCTLSDDHLKRLQALYSDTLYALIGDTKTRPFTLPLQEAAAPFLRVLDMVFEAEMAPSQSDVAQFMAFVTASGFVRVDSLREYVLTFAKDDFTLTFDPTSVTASATTPNGCQLFAGAKLREACRTLHCVMPSLCVATWD